MLSVMRNAAFLIAAATGLTPPSAELVAGTSLAGKNLECAYLASRDGWGASDFHRCVDDCGSTLVVCKTQRGLTFGGFNPLGYRSTDDYGGTSNAFINKSNSGTVPPVHPGTAGMHHNNHSVRVTSK